jgi:hypothetical protein
VDGWDSVLTGAERRRAVARIREQVEKGHGCTHLEAITMLDYVSHIQEELISVYSSEEYALAILDRRIACWSLGDAPARG